MSLDPQSSYRVTCAPQGGECFSAVDGEYAELLWTPAFLDMTVAITAYHLRDMVTAAGDLLRGRPSSLSISKLGVGAYVSSTPFHPELSALALDDGSFLGTIRTSGTLKGRAAEYQKDVKGYGVIAQQIYCSPGTGFKCYGV